MKKYLLLAAVLFTVNLGLISCSDDDDKKENNNPGEDVYKDAEGLQTVQNLARNMAFMIKAIKGAGGKPEMKHESWTHFIR